LITKFERLDFGGNKKTDAPFFNGKIYLNLQIVQNAPKRKVYGAAAMRAKKSPLFLSKSGLK